MTGDHGAPAALQGQTILVLEDEYFLATEIRRTLTRAGAEVVGPFPTVEEGLSASGGDRPLDAALLDINLRGETVYPVADHLRQRGVALVFMTGYDRDALPAAYRDVPICEKPVTLSSLMRHLAGPSVRSPA